MPTLTYQNAKKSFDEMLMWVQQEPIEIERNGKSVAIIMSYEDYKNLEKLKLELLKFRNRPG